MRRGFIILLFLALVMGGCLSEGINAPVDNPSIKEGSAESVDLGFTAEVTSPISRGATSSYRSVPLDRGIVVTGEGRVRVKPDIAVFTAGVVTTGQSSDEAISQNSETMAEVINSLKEAGVLEDDIQTQSISIWPQFDYSTRSEGEPPVILGYRAENRVEVTLRDLTKVGSAIDAATGAGSNQIYGISFTVSDERGRSLRAKALTAAVDDAKEKARAIADALDAATITPISVVESGGFTPPIFRSDVAVLERGAVSTPVSPGEIDVSASVTVTFDFDGS